jgi:signal transduction histidine kinase
VKAPPLVHSQPPVHTTRDVDPEHNRPGVVLAGPRPVMPSVRLHQAMLAAALLVPAALFGAAAWRNLHELRREAADTVVRTAAIMHEHARKVFETEELLLSLIEERVAGLPPAEVASPFTSAFMRRVKAPLAQAVSAWIAGPDGATLAGTQAWRPDSNIAGRDFFQVQQTEGAGTYISGPYTGRSTGQPSFAISRRRTGEDGGFGGTIHAAASPAYFTQFYQDAAPPYAHLALLIRADGAVLAREPADALTHLPGGVLMQRIAEQPDGGVFQARLHMDGVDRTYAYRRVAGYPVYVAFGMDEAAVMQRWHGNLRIYGVFAGVAALTLLGVSLLALRGARAEQAALLELRQESRQRQAAEAQLRHSQRMDAVGQLTGGIAHDFNNLLTVVMGNLELIERAAGYLPDGDLIRAKVIRLAATAVTAVQRGAALTRGLLAFARCQPLQVVALDVNALLADFAGLVRQAVGAPVTVAFMPAPNLPLCRADPAQLEAAVLNLAINARDAMPQGGQLNITTGTATLDAAALAGNPEAQPGTFITVTVADTGIGMTPDIAASAFEPFFTTKPIGQGTGLGLSQVFGFARQLSGHVTIRSAPGEGTAIVMFLPAAPST